MSLLAVALVQRMGAGSEFAAQSPSGLAFALLAADQTVDVAGFGQTCFGVFENCHTAAVIEPLNVTAQLELLVGFHCSKAVRPICCRQGDAAGSRSHPKEQ